MAGFGRGSRRRCGVVPSGWAVSGLGEFLEQCLPGVGDGVEKVAGDHTWWLSYLGGRGR